MNETAPIAAIVDTGEGYVYEERIVPPDVAEAVGRGDVVDLAPYTAIRFTLEEAREHLDTEANMTKDRIAQLVAEIDQLEAEHPELRERRERDD
jgi:hypothetical protein